VLASLYILVLKEDQHWAIQQQQQLWDSAFPRQ
jgi:hypothetical protein